MKLKPLLILGFLLLAISAFGQTITITAPVQRIVYQQNAQHVAMVPIKGTFTGSIVSVEARAIVMLGYNSGSNTEWTAIGTTSGAFSGTLTVPAGGWYQIEVQCKDANNAVVASAKVLKVGVGEVFITLGQSNSANCGYPPQTPVDDRVSTWDGSVHWVFAKDPQPIGPFEITGSGGSPWPPFASLIVQRLNVPVGLISVGIGGASVEKWLPSGNYYRRLRGSLKYVGVGGARAVLWHQGEADAMAGTSTANYVSRLNTIINQSRIDAGYTVPWGIALVSWIGPGYEANQPAVRAGQVQVVNQGTAMFQGPDTDTYITPDLRLSIDGVHMNGAGLQRHGRLWADILCAGLLKDVPGVATSNSPIKTNGVLVRIWGRVTKVTSTYIYIDDGSGYDDGSGNGQGIRVMISGLVNPITKSFEAGTTYVKGVTGVSGVDTDGVPCVRPRNDDDINL
ncbi:MAG: sialate O-acetylesterase [Armatimonadota bacterium]|nr:sialate O-acetylesterase [bacterium]